MELSDNPPTPTEKWCENLSKNDQSLAVISRLADLDDPIQKVAII